MGRKSRPGDLSTRQAAEQLTRIYFKYHGICQLCWQFCVYKDASRDHVVPLCRGGTSDDDNIVLAHKDCNAGRDFITKAIVGTIRRQANGYHIVAQRRNPTSTFAPYSDINSRQQ